MKIEHDLVEDLYKVIDSSLELDEIYLSSEILQYLENQEKLKFLEDMLFSVSLPNNSWEISDTIPTGIPGEIASIIFRVEGIVQRRNDKIVCIIP